MLASSKQEVIPGMAEAKKERESREGERERGFWDAGGSVCAR